MAATLSPPPTTETASLSARAFATASVPFANAANSNTPIGPFQTTFFALFISPTMAATVLGPISKPMRPSGMSTLSTATGVAFSSNLSAQTWSRGRITFTPFFSAAAKKAFAVS